ncbi:oligosaccharide flippase family protein [Chelativorans sp.]|uniref:oligosaccharide flippase family protein n=1 Tax=Chelativorans sp. TaxID=2203393 RepID=UPI0028111758|nr:oligosaccharide flippase family protein [Chelativorans sp.]
MDQRAHRFFAAALAGIGGRLVGLLAPLVTTPALLSYFGDEEFGIWATSVSATSIAVVADLGIGNGLLTRVASASGRGDRKSIRAYVSNAYVALSAVATIALSITTMAFLVWPVSPIAVAVVVVFIMSLPGTVLYQFLYGIQRVPTSNLLLAVGAAGSVLGCFLAIGAQAPTWAVAVAYSLPPVLTSIGGAIWFFRRAPEYRPTLNAVSWQHARDLLKLGSGFFFLSILTAVGLNIDNLIISATAGPEAVPPYAIPMRLASVLSLLIMAVFMPLWGANGEALATRDYNWVRQSALNMSLAGAGVVAISGGMLILLSNMIMTVWIGRTFEDQHLVLSFAVLAATIIAATSPYNMVLNALGRPLPQIGPWLAFVILSISLKLALLIGQQRVWPIAAVTGLVYALVVTPVVIVAALRGLRTEAGR